jgi:hypothetical protein
VQECDFRSQQFLLSCHVTEADEQKSCVTGLLGHVKNFRCFLILQESFQEILVSATLFTSLHIIFRSWITFTEVTLNNLRIMGMTQQKSMRGCKEPFLSGRSLPFISLREISVFVGFKKCSTKCATEVNF